MRPAAVADLDHMQRIGAHEGHGHGHRRAVGEHGGGVLAVGLDVAEDIVPASAIEADDILPQLIENGLGVKGAGQRFDQHRRLDRAGRKPEPFLAEGEDVRPQPRLLMMLQFGEVEIGARPGVEQRLRIVKGMEAEIDEGAGHALAVDRQMCLVEMPAARPHLEDRDLLAERIVLAADGVVIADRAPDSIVEIDLGANDVLRRRRKRVLDVGHEDAGAGIERVDHHLALGGPGDLDAPVLKVRGHAGDTPVGVGKSGMVARKTGALAGIEPRLPAFALGQKGAAPFAETRMQRGHEGKRVPIEDLLRPRHRGQPAQDLTITHHSDSSARSLKKRRNRRFIVS